MSDFSVSCIGKMESDDACSRKKALHFLKGTLKAKEEELIRLREEKEADMESKLELMMGVKQAKSGAIEMGTSSKISQADEENDAAVIESKIELMVEEKIFKKESATMAKMLSQAEKNKEAALESKIGLMMDVKLAKQETAEMSRKLLQADKEKEIAVIECKLELMNMCRKQMEERKERDAAIESKIDHLVEELKVPRKEVTEKVDIEKLLSQMKREKEEVIAAVKLGREEIAELSRNFTKAWKEQEEKHTEEMRSLMKRITELEKVQDSPKTVKDPDYVWNISGGKVAFNDSGLLAVDTLRCPPLKSGIFAWKIRIRVEKYGNVVLGFVSSSKKAELNNEIELGRSKNSLGYYYDGSANRDCENTGQKFPEFTNGSVVHFVLDLTGSGTLRVSAEGSSQVAILPNLNYSLDEGEGFLPAVSPRNVAKVELLDFESK